MTNRAENADTLSQMAISRPISAWKRSDDSHQSRVLRISTLAVTITPMPAECSAMRIASSALRPAAISSFTRSAM
ncbi:hypothetical protein D3C71_1941830 [compost metagenome]